jgi:stearoyl-CoA desaturase (delta-9 desaturase)
MSHNLSAATGPKLRGGLHLRHLNWPIVSFMLAVHLIALLAFVPALFTWTGLILTAFFCWVSAGLGITLCFHRLLTHRSFRTPKWFEYLITTFACLALQGGPVTWVGMHRLHHKFSDSDRDPHTPKHGFTWAHMLWMLHHSVDDQNARDAAKDLLRDPFISRLDRIFWLPQVLLTLVLFTAGYLYAGPIVGLSWIVWAVAVRTVLVFHFTWFVNSAAHTWGYQNYRETGEHSTNLWWVALLSFGEGWHNNHHAHPRSAAHGLRWFELDLTYLTIRLLSCLGLARDIKIPEPHELPGRSAPTNPSASTPPLVRSTPAVDAPTP